MDPITGLISVAMCTYNGEAYLDAQLLSILKQSYAPLEVVICDDASTDRTPDILKAWQMQYPEIIRVYYNTKNLGFNRNFEQAIQYCKGNLIAISDQDDIWLPEKLAKQVALFTKSPKTLLVHCASLNFTGDYFHYRKGQLRWSYLYTGHDCRNFLVHNHISGHCMLFKKELVNAALPIPVGVYYDWWIAAIATFCGEIDAVKEYLVHHRLHPNNAYYTKRNMRSPNTKINQLLLQRLEEHPNCPAAVKNFLQTTDGLLKQSIDDQQHTGYYLPLFMHAMRYKEIFFGHKKRKNRLLREWSQLKSCIKMSKR